MYSVNVTGLHKNVCTQYMLQVYIKLYVLVYVTALHKTVCTRYMLQVYIKLYVPSKC